MDKATQDLIVASVVGLGVGVAVGIIAKTIRDVQPLGFIPKGAVIHKKLPPWTTGRMAEEIMADDLKAAVYRGKNDPRVRELAISIIKAEGLDGRQHKEIASAFQRYMQNDENVLYVNDPVRTEIFQEAYKTLLEIKAGDCDDQAVAMAALLMSVGIPVKLILLSQEQPFNPKTSRFKHIFVAAVIDGKDYWVETILRPPVEFDYRHPHTGLMLIDMSTPRASKKVVVAADELDGLSDLGYGEHDAAFLII
ncbi:MAG: hypothetical protein A2W25_04160 [candidate division Zixibacteria bacterium RBG_16_53_22]|nr:MAG: hypothetical protein A2W25_04160 [candidate division Zixibacteria bacterium RBG_16_53_22]